ncbi:hypothetical protein ACHAXS_011860 [Conticribra weissflogii]
MTPSTTAKPHRYFLQNFLADFSAVDSHHVESKYEEEASKIFTTNNQIVGGDDSGLLAISDDILWLAGLKLLHRILFEGGEGFDEKNNGINIAMSPHELLRTVVDSFHFQDKELDLSNFIPAEKHLKRQQPQKQQILESSHISFRLPSSLAMFVLYILLISHAVQWAATRTVESLATQQPENSTAVIRWRRLKSMVDDAQYTFRRMLLQLTKKAVSKMWWSVDDDISSHCSYSSGINDRACGVPIRPIQILHVAIWAYTKHLLPSCRQLLTLIIKNVANTNANPISKSRIWEPCLNSFGILTNLAALECCFVDNDDNFQLSIPSRCSQSVVECIDDSMNNEFYEMFVSSMTTTTAKERREQLFVEKDSNSASYYEGRGTLLAEDILFLPLGCQKSKSYDELGIAMIAYHRLVAHTQQTIQNKPSLTTLPFPFSGGHLWALYFPNAKTLLAGPWKSSILKTLFSPETPSSSMDDEGIALITFKIAMLGLDMLHKLIHEAPFVRPSRQYFESARKHGHIWKHSHSSKLLGSTIEAILSLILRISALEATRSPDKTSSNNTPAPKYTSQQVASMAQSLMEFYNPSVQVAAICEISRKIKQDHFHAVLLPKVLDWLRPLLMNICKKSPSEVDISRDIALANDMTTVLDPFLADLENIFDESSLLPRDVSVFFSSIETFTSLFALFRLLKIWMNQASKRSEIIGMNADGNAGHDSMSSILDWADGCHDKLVKFNSRLGLLIDYWTQSASRMADNDISATFEALDGPPQDFHRCFLLRFHLDEVLNEK